MRSTIFAVVGIVGATICAARTADAAGRPAKTQAAAQDLSAHPKSGYYRRKPQVRGYVQRRGGYSYFPQDSINTYGDSRTRYGSVNSYRDPITDRQTRNGPFDHGFFFDSGLGLRGGDSPYHN